MTEPTIPSVDIIERILIDAGCRDADRVARQITNALWKARRLVGSDPISLHPYNEDYCQHDLIEGTCELCAATLIRCPFDDYPLMSHSDECPFGPHPGQPIRNGATWSALMATIDELTAVTTGGAA